MGDLWTRTGGFSIAGSGFPLEIDFLIFATSLSNFLRRFSLLRFIVLPFFGGVYMDMSGMIM
jgi:hypothetical protein